MSWKNGWLNGQVLKKRTSGGFFTLDRGTRRQECEQRGDTRVNDAVDHCMVRVSNTWNTKKRQRDRNAGEEKGRKGAHVPVTFIFLSVHARVSFHAEHISRSNRRPPPPLPALLPQSALTAPSRQCDPLLASVPPPPLDLHRHIHST